jgi:hypothetical protein
MSVVRFEALMANIRAKIISGDQPLEFLIKNRRFRGLLRLHHEGRCDTADRPRRF